MGVTITSGVHHTAMVTFLRVLRRMMVAVRMCFIGAGQIARGRLRVRCESLVMRTRVQRETLAHRAEHEGERPEQGGKASSRRRTGR